MNEKEIAAKLENAALKIIIAFLAIVVFGVAIIPGVMAYFYHTWKWLLIYPGCLLGFLIYAYKNSKKG